MPKKYYVIKNYFFAYLEAQEFLKLHFLTQFSSILCQRRGTKLTLASNITSHQTKRPKFLVNLNSSEPMYITYYDKSRFWILQYVNNNSWTIGPLQWKRHNVISWYYYKPKILEFNLERLQKQAMYLIFQCHYSQLILK